MKNEDAHDLAAFAAPGADTLDAFVSGIGTGGTLVGLDQGFRDHGIPARAVAAVPIRRTGASGAPGCFTRYFSTELFQCENP